MGSEESKAKEGDGVRLFVGLVAVSIDFVSTAIGLWDCRRKGCSKKEKALLRRRRNTPTLGGLGKCQEGGGCW